MTGGGTGSLWIHAPTALNGALVIAEDCEVALDVDLKRPAQDTAAWLSMIGGGRLTVRRGYPGVTYQTSGDATTMREPFAIDGTLAFEGPNAAIQVWWSARYNFAIFSASTMENQGHSRIEVAPDCTLTTGCSVLSGRSRCWTCRRARRTVATVKGTSRASRTGASSSSIRIM